jgi:uncharacterized protein (TIGR03437 family)
MRLLSVASIALALPLFLSAQTADTAYFQGTMLPGNEMPPVTGFDTSGLGTLIAHAVRDSSGKIISGSVDFWVDYKYPQALTATGLHIHNGAAGVSGPVTINTGLSAANNYNDATGVGRIERQAQVLPTDAAALATLQGLFDNPTGFYVNMHSTEYPGGFIRAQLQRASVVRLMGIMTSENEVPANMSGNSAVSSVTAIAVQDGSGVFTSGSVIFDVNYTTPSPVTFTGLHIHKGNAGVNGPVEIPTTVASVPSDPSGKGNLRYPINVNVANPLAQDGLNGLFTNPGGYYINVHTTADPGGTARAQLRATDQMVYPVSLLPSNEVPPVTDYAASGPGQITINTIRRPDGSVEAGIVTFDVNYRFPDSPTVTGFHIHDGVAGMNGPVIINTGLSGANSLAASPLGNIYRIVTVAGPAGINTLNSLVSTPQNQYVNLHTSVYGGGVIRAQIGTANPGPPMVSAVISAVSDATLTSTAPGELISIYGTNFANAIGNLQGVIGGTVPMSLNGISATIASQAAPIVYVSPTVIVAQVPFEAMAGSLPLVITTNGTASSTFTLPVVPTAPALFFDATGGIVLRNADYSLIRPDNRAAVNDVLLAYGTGFGQTTPASRTGQPVRGISNTQPVTVTIDGVSAPVIYSIASPSFVGLYQVAFRVPAGIRAGTSVLKISSNGVTSNTVMLPTISTNPATP